MRFLLAVIIAVFLLGFSAYQLFQGTDTIIIMIPMAIAIYFLSIGFKIKSKGMKLRYNYLKSDQKNTQNIEYIKLVDDFSTTLNSTARSIIKTILIVTAIGIVGLIVMFLITWQKSPRLLRLGMNASPERRQGLPCQSGGNNVMMCS